jgi:hypothetical protein
MTLALEVGEWSQHVPAALFTPGKDTVPIVQEAGWAPGPVWTGAEKLAPTGIRSPDRPARSHSLYRLSYPAHTTNITRVFKSREIMWTDQAVRNINANMILMGNPERTRLHGKSRSRREIILKWVVKK